MAFVSDPKVHRDLIPRVSVEWHEHFLRDFLLCLWRKIACRKLTRFLIPKMKSDNVRFGLAKAEILFWSQQEVVNYLMGHPVLIDTERSNLKPCSASHIRMNTDVLIAVLNVEVFISIDYLPEPALSSQIFLSFSSSSTVSFEEVAVTIMPTSRPSARTRPTWCLE